MWQHERGRSVPGERYTFVVAHDEVRQLLATDVALDKLGARGISAAEVEQLLRNRHVTVRNPRASAARATCLLLIGVTDGGRVLTVVVERTADPATWLIITGWVATAAERKILERSL